MIAKAVAAHVSDTLMSEITAARKQVYSKDNEIMFLKDKVQMISSSTVGEIRTASIEFRSSKERTLMIFYQVHGKGD